jgi:hypothetical protein
MSTLRAANLANPTSPSTNITLDTAGNATVAGTMAMGSSFLRNRIINGDMRIDQRNAGASVTPTNAYTLDRWVATTTQASKFSVQQVSTAPSGFTNSLKVTSLSAYSVLTGDTFYIAQRIEGNNISDLAWGTASAQTVTLSFWVRSSLTGTFGAAITNDTATVRSYPFSYTINAADTWEYKTITVPGDTSGTWASGTAIGIAIRFGLGTGSTYSGTSGAWATANVVQPTSTVSVVGTNAATWYITGVQLESGTVATPFERRLYGQELMLCQRYYEAGNTSFRQYAVNGSNGVCSVFFKTTKRSAPTATAANSGGLGTPTVTTTAVDYIQATLLQSGATGAIDMFFTWTASAEL